MRCSANSSHLPFLPQVVRYFAPHATQHKNFKIRGKAGVALSHAATQAGDRSDPVSLGAYAHALREHSVWSCVTVCQQCSAHTRRVEEAHIPELLGAAAKLLKDKAPEGREAARELVHALERLCETQGCELADKASAALPSAEASAVLAVLAPR